MKSIRLLGAVTIGAVLALGVAACGSSTHHANAQTAASTSDDMVTVIPSLSGVGTSVALDPGTAAALKSLGVSVTPSGSASFDAATSTVTFPITSGYAEIHSDHSFKPGYILGSIQHTGSGLYLSAGPIRVNLSNFVVDPGNSMLYGTVGTATGVPLLFLDGTNVRVSNDPAGHVVLDGTVARLTQTAATALDQAFHTTAVTAGLPLGTVHLVAAGTPVTYDAAKDHTTDITRLTGRSTSVRLNPSTASALQSLGVQVGPQGSATFDAATSTVSFPITGGFAAIHSDHKFKPGYIAGSIVHDGSGLTFTKGQTSLTIKDFVVDPGDSELYGVAGNAVVTQPLLFLDGSHVKVHKDSRGDVVLDGTVAELTDASANALNQTFGVTAFHAGIPVGTVHLVASGS